MKKQILQNLLAILLMFFTGISFSGCGTPPTRVAVEVAGTQNALVIGAMKAWADYSNAGNTTQSQIDIVKNLYAKYQDAVKIEQTALLAFQASPTNQPAYQTALSVTVATAGDLIAFVHQFTK